MHIRKPAVAGAFYPANPEGLTAEIQTYLDHVPPTRERKAVGFVVPHAGYVYSGPVAAYAYKCLVGQVFQKVVIVAPSHFDGFGGLSFFSGDALETPLGTVEVSGQDRDRLLRHDGVRSSLDGFRQEHSLEVQLPFLQHVLQPGWIIVPLVMGFQHRPTIDLTAKILSEYIDQETLVIISSDLSHYYPYEMAKEIDARFCSLVEQGDLDALWDAYEQRRVEACGFGPVFAFLTATDRRTDVSLEVLDCRNSGDTAGTHGQVVGYCALGCFWKE